MAGELVEANNIINSAALYKRDPEEVLQLMELMTKNPDTIQQQVLADILAQNAGTEYLQRYKLDGSTDRQTFKQKLPLITYNDVRADIQRIAKGDRSPILSSHPITEFFTSSGTSSGERKLIPVIEEEWGRREFLGRLRIALFKKALPGSEDGLGLYFMFAKHEIKTPGGLPAQSALTSYRKSKAFFEGSADDPCTCPNDIILCHDYYQSMYAQMLYGLYQSQQVTRIGAPFASALLRAIRFLQLHFQELAHDISTATLNPKITDPTVRKLTSILLSEPKPDLATFIINECSGENWEGIMGRIWPNTMYVESVITGAMSQYLPSLRYYTGDLPLAAMTYGSSECYSAINLNPICEPHEISYTIVPNMAYFEFLPCDDHSVGPVDLVDVQVGKEYEPVVTTHAGFYRFKVGDILRVAGFHNATPRFQFVSRKDVILSIDSDKTDEAELRKAVEAGSELLREFETSVVEYTCYGDAQTIPGHYVVYWEVVGKDPANMPGDQVFQRCCLAMEESLNSVYRQCRVQDQSIGPLEIRIVRSGTFQEVMDQAVSRGASSDQYKVPRCVSFAPILELLDSRVVSSHFSPAFPRWSPVPQEAADGQT